VRDNTCEIVGVLRSGALCQAFIFKYCNLDVDVRHLRLNMQNVNLTVPYVVLTEVMPSPIEGYTTELNSIDIAEYHYVCRSKALFMSFVAIETKSSNISR
jgi:hypothetical protein